MFDSLKKKLSKSVEILANKIKSEEPKEEKIIEKPKIEKKSAEKQLKKIEKPKIKESEAEVKEEPVIEEPKKPSEKKGFRERITGRIFEKELTDKDIDDFFNEIELDLLEANVAMEVADHLRMRMKELLAGSKIKRSEADDFVKNAFEKILVEILNQGKIYLLKMKKPSCIVFLGFNGSGKTTTIAKIGNYLKNNKKSSVLAAGDTWRAAAIEQLEHHGEKLNLKVIKHKYGSDSAAVIFDAREHARSKGIDYVLADTAGRSHADKNLMDEIKKVVRVNQPELKVLVVDSLTGNDIVEQARKFNEAVGVDAMVFTKIDVNKKGGSLLSACYAIKKPIIFIGVGQDYGDIETFDPRKIAKEMLG